MNSYTTIQGETWDLIAYKLWGSEYLLPLLLEANPQHRHTLFFSGDVILNVPEIDIAIYTPRPVWLGEDDDL
ncbi:tail protein X [Lysinibacillus irui]|uniref:phage tail protein n=1 Tax=Lysinibacillus irui TaxID=2998077 RepID=UPI002AD24171|nr:phage tail protein [Lysinibacillus irui]MEA0565304.1 phage tail protein [Lysinibacillus irui]